MRQEVFVYLLNRYINVEELSQVIGGCLKNDRKSQFALYHYCFDGMMSICRRYEKDEDMALEILNLSFIKILKNLAKYKRELSFAPWYKKITINTAIDEYRKKQLRQEIINNEIDYLENLSAGTDSATLDWIEDEYLKNLLTHLKEEERIVFNLYAIDGLSHREVAALLDISERTSIRHLSSARRNLQEFINQGENRLSKA